jgi:ubiquinone/menaquinone biosynthesis C-methylase UbiE
VDSADRVASHAAAAKAESWGDSYRLVAAEKWKAKSAVMGSAVTEALVEYSAPRVGMQVIDLASGTGEPAISLAQRVAPGGKVMAVDLSADLLELATARARKRKLSNFLTCPADVHELPFPDATFDLASCRFGVMYFKNVGHALCEIRRVLRRGARACFAAWGTVEQPYWQTTMKIVHRHVGGPMLEACGEDIFCFAAPGSLSRALAAAGFREVDESERSVPWTWQGSAEEVFEYARAVSTPFRPMLERVREEHWPGILSDTRDAINQYRVGEEIRFGARVILASGRA